MTRSRLLLAGCAFALAGGAVGAYATPEQTVPLLRPSVLATYPHDRTAFTQGLVLHQRALYESTGQYAKSDVRRVRLATGRVVRRWRFPERFFGEGLAAVGDRLYALTYRERTAHVLGRQTFRVQRTFRYDGEGWGLCFDGRRLAMSNGSSTITFRDAITFLPTRKITVRLPGGTPVAGLAPGAVENINELECVGSSIYANVWLTDLILKIDARTGVVQAVIDAAGLLTGEEAKDADVLNGIAAFPGGERFLLTGKYWPKLFLVRFQ
ncbi:MAG: glutaminyl-peptide cyclotransferase [Gaiella sp.]